MKLQPRGWAKWLGVVLIAVVLTWIALGHRGLASEDHTIRILPFVEYGDVIACVFQGCIPLRSAALFLLINGLGNIVVFMPLGAAVWFACHPRCVHPIPLWIATAVGLGISMLYEVIQLWIPGRVSATDDVILNTAGA